MKIRMVLADEIDPIESLPIVRDGDTISFHKTQACGPTEIMMRNFSLSEVIRRHIEQGRIVVSRADYSPPITREDARKA